MLIFQNWKPDPLGEDYLLASVKCKQRFHGDKILAVVKFGGVSQNHKIMWLLEHWHTKFMVQVLKQLTMRLPIVVEKMIVNFN